MERELHEADLNRLLAEVERRLSQYSASGPHRRVHGAEDHVGAVGGGGHTIQEDGVSLAARTNLNFVDTAVVVATDGGAIPNSTLITLTGYAALAGRAGGQTFIGGTGPNENLVWQSTSNAARGYISAVDDIRMTATKGIEDSLGTLRFTPATASPHVTLTGDTQITGSGTGTTAGALQFSGTGDFFGITMAQSATSTTWIGAQIAPNVVTAANNALIAGIKGQALVNVNAHTGVSATGLDFAAIVAASSATTTGVVAKHYGARVLIQSLQLISTTTTLAITDSDGLHVDRTIQISNTVNTITTAYTNIRGLNLPAPAITLIGAGTKVVTVTNWLGIDVAALAISNASVTVTNAIQLRVGDVTGNSFTAANNRIVQFGSATPTTTSGLFEVMANFTAAANVTPVWISEGATPTRRQLQTKAGNTLVAGDLVCVLV